MRMMTGRDQRTFECDEEPVGLRVGSWIMHPERDIFLGRVVSITDNGDRDDWITGHPTRWYVTIEKPWNQVNMNTTIGATKIEWLDDEMFPRIGTVISADPHGHFLPGDIVRVQ
jgi:hypothetical protein